MTIIAIIMTILFFIFLDMWDTERIRRKVLKAENDWNINIARARVGRIRELEDKIGAHEDELVAQERTRIDTLWEEKGITDKWRRRALQLEEDMKRALEGEE